MATETRTENGEIGEETKSTNRGRGKSTKGTGTTDSKTTTETSGRGTDGDRGCDGDRGTETEKVVPIVANVEKSKTKRKPRKVTKKKSDSNNIGAEQISILLTSLSAIVASRPNTAHWQLTPQESQSIAEPLAKIIEKNENLKNLGEHADALALVTACITVIAPRAILSVNMAKSEKEKKKHGRNVITNTETNQRPKQDKERENITSSQGDNRTNATDAENDVTSEFFIGDAISY